MQCDRCRSDPVIFQPYSGRNLCRNHFIADFEARAKRAIRKHQWVRPGDHIAVPHTGDRCSSALLIFLQELAGRRRDVRISVIPGHQEITADPDDSSYEEEALAQIGATCLARATSLDEIAVSVVIGFLRGLPGTSALDRGERHRHAGGPLPHIYPFSGIPAEEIVLYAQLLGVGSDNSPAGESPGKFHAEINAFLNGYSLRHPATKYAVANVGRRLEDCNLLMVGEMQ